MDKENKANCKMVMVPQTPVTIHISFNESLTLKELSKVMDLINLAFNDINRKNGVTSTVKIGQEYAAKVAGVGSGSIILYILTSFVVPITVGILADFLYDRLKTIGAKKEKNQVKLDTAYPISINVNGDNNLIEVHITKPSNNDAA